MEKTNRSINYKIALTGVFGALSVVLSFTPLGYIQIGLLAITIMHIPVILAVILAGLVPGVSVGLIFGLSSLIRAAQTGSPFFINPLCSVLPRMIFP
ncbi:MAG: ECF transporter S component, partial [Treponema sp.]|nr:ECF transporter S component [Treponema sp.]